MADNLNYFFHDEGCEWLANIDLSLSDRPKEEKQLDENDISLFIEENSNMTTRQFRSALQTSVTHS